MVLEGLVVTEDDAIALSLDDECAARALEDIDCLFGVSVCDLQPRLVLLVFLEITTDY